MRLGKLPLAALALLCLLAISACGAAGSDGSADQGKGITTETGEAALDAAEKGRQAAQAAGGRTELPSVVPLIATINKKSEDAKRVTAQFTNAMGPLGWKSQSCDGKGKASQLEKCFEGILKKNPPDVVFTYGFDPSDIGGTMKLLEEKEIEVVAMGQQVSPSPGLTAQYHPDTDKQASLINEYLRDKLASVPEAQRLIAATTEPIAASEIAFEDLKATLAGEQASQGGQATNGQATNGQATDGAGQTTTGDQSSEGRTQGEDQTTTGDQTSETTAQQEGEAQARAGEDLNVDIVERFSFDVAKQPKDQKKVYEDALKRNPELKAFWLFPGPMAATVGKVVKEKGGGKTFPERPLVTGFNADKSVLQALRKKEVDAVSDVAYDGTVYVAIDQATQFYARDKDFADEPRPEYPITFLEPELLTPEVAPPPGEYRKPEDDFVTFFTTKWLEEFGQPAQKGS